MKRLCLIVCILFLGNVLSAQNIKEVLDEQDNLILKISDEMENITKSNEQLKQDKENIEKHCEKLEEHIEKSNEIIFDMTKIQEDMRKALISNREDESFLVRELGDLNVIINEQEQKRKRTNTVVNVMIPTMTIPMIACGFAVLRDNETLGKAMIITGTSCLIGFELVWHCGRLEFINLW